MNNTENTQINDSVREQHCYEQKQKIFEYIEIEHNLHLASEWYFDYYHWIENSCNDNFWNRLTSNQYGKFKIEIFVCEENRKRRLATHKITKILNIYGRQGYEVISVRNTVDKDRYSWKTSRKYEDDNYRKHYFYQQTIYTLKKESYINFEVYQELLNQEHILLDKLEEEPETELEATQQKATEEDDDEDPTSQIPIEELQLSVRACNCLKRAQVNSLSNLLDYTQEDLLKIKNMSQKSADEIVEALQDQFGITLCLKRS